MEYHQISSFDSKSTTQMLKVYLWVPFFGWKFRPRTYQMAEVVLIATAVVVALPVLISLAKALLKLIRKTLFAKVLEKDVQNELEKLQTEVQSAEERLQNLAATTTINNNNNNKLLSPTAMAMEDLDVLLDEMKKRVDEKYTEKLQRRKRDQFGLKNGVAESRNKKDKHELEHFRRELARCLRHLELAVGEEEGLKTLKCCADRLKSIVDKYVIRGLARSEYKPHDSTMRLNLAD